MLKPNAILSLGCCVRLEGIVGWRKKKKEALRGPYDLEARELTEIPAAQPQFFSSKRRLRKIR
jgi:hypothetical protein